MSFCRSQHRFTGSGDPVQYTHNNLWGYRVLHLRKQVNFLEGCSDSRSWSPNEIISPRPQLCGLLFCGQSFLWAVLLVSCSPSIDSPLGRQHTGPDSSNKPGISVLVDFTNTIQRFLVKIEWLCCRAACIILKISPLLLVGDGKQQSDSLIPKVCA